MVFGVNVGIYGSPMECLGFRFPKLGDGVKRRPDSTLESERTRPDSTSGASLRLVTTRCERLERLATCYYEQTMNRGEIKCGIEPSPVNNMPQRVNSGGKLKGTCLNRVYRKA